MGASKEGAMSVRDRPYLTTDEGGESSSSLLRDTCTDPLSDKALEDGNNVPSSESMGTSSLSSNETIVSGMNTSPTTSTKIKPRLNVRNLFAEARAKVYGGCESDFERNVESKEFLQKFLADTLKSLNDLTNSLAATKTECHLYKEEKEKLSISLEEERGESTFLRKEIEILKEGRRTDENEIKAKDEKILKLERRVVELTTPKLVDHKETSITPPPLSSLVDIYRLEDDSPAPKRRKANTINDEIPAVASTSSVFPKPSPVSSLLQSYQGNHVRRSLTPRLSHVATSKSSATLKSSILGSGGKIIRINQVGSSSAFHPADNVHEDELDRSDYPRDDEKESHLLSISQRLLPSSSSAFSRPSPTNKSRHLDQPTPAGKRRFISNYPPWKSVNSPKHTYSKTSPSTSATSIQSESYSSNDISGLIATPSSFTQFVSARTNNFLKPQTSRQHPVTLSPSSAFSNQHTLCSSKEATDPSHFRSLDSSVANADVAISEDGADIDQESIATDIPPPIIKKKVGRPPGSRPRKRLPVSESTASDITDKSRLSNGAYEESQSKPELPAPRFSKRGRLLKPNRARYSPDPDSSHSREKFMSTKKSYYVSEPFCTDGYAELLDFGLSGNLPIGETDELTRHGMDESDVGSLSTRVTETETRSDAEISEPVVEVPGWRISVMEGFDDDDEERLSPDDDMSEEAFVKRHQKPEAQEKQRKRWDMQKMREESYKERMQRKEEERAKQKELRRQQRKRKGRNGTTEEEEIVNPSLEDIKAIYVSEVLPVGAFGQTLPINEKVDFRFATGSASSLPPPSPKLATTILDKNNDDASELISDSSNRDEIKPLCTDVVEGSAKEINLSSTNIVVDDEREDVVVTEVGRSSSMNKELPPTSPLPSCSSPLSPNSFQSFPSFPSPSVSQSSSLTPPPVIYCIQDKTPDVYEYTDEDEGFPTTPIDIKPLPVLHCSQDEVSEHTSSSTHSAPREMANDTSLVSDCTLSKSCPDKEPTFSELTCVEKSHKSGGVTRIENLNIIRLPISSTAALPSATSASTANAGSIKFVIPNNPLARQRPTSIPSSPSSAMPGSSYGSRMVEANDDVPLIGENEKS